MTRYHGQLELGAKAALTYWGQFLASQKGIRQQLWSYNPQPTAIGFKVADLSGVIQTQEVYFDLGDMMVSAEVEGRTISTIRKAEPFSNCESLRYVKVIQRRLGSDGRLGLDHLDVTVTAHTDLSSLDEWLRDIGVTCRQQSNGSHSWLSIIHNEFEFKIVDHTVWRVCCDQIAASLRADESVY